MAEIQIYDGKRRTRVISGWKSVTACGNKLFAVLQRKLKIDQGYW
jgi:hypothetical protein